MCAGPAASRSNSNPWWNKECEEAVRLKRVMYRHYSKDQNAETHERMKAANRDYNKIIAQAKKDHWIAFADSISAGKADLGSVWKKIRRMKQQCVVPDSDLQHGSTKYTTAQSKADALAKAFPEASDTDSLPADRQQFRREMEATFTHPVPDDSLAVNTPLTCTELRRALASIKKVKVSTGVDTVSYRMLKEAHESFLKILLDFFQRCWDGGTIPAGWKHAIVVPIHKHGKPRKELGSYRPISLTSHLGKVYEWVIKNRLEYYCESKKAFPVCQAGFRRGRGVTDHLVKLGEHVGRATGRRKVLLTCFFDISRAYDQVWHAKLLQKLNKIGISGNMYNYSRSFLSDRSMQVRWKGATSTTKGVSMGVPQGSVIAPLLFNIMVHDVDTAVKGKVVLTMYADDLAIWPDTHIRRLHTNSSWVKQSMKLFQEAVDFPENGVRPIPHQHLSEHGGAHQGERAEHLCIERSQVPGCTLHSLGAYEPAGRAQRAERLPSPQRDQGAICSALGQHPQDPSERGAGPGALTPVVRTGSHAPPLENGSSPSHRHRGARSATGPRAAAVRAAVPGVQRGRAPPVPPPHPARL